MFFLTPWNLHTHTHAHRGMDKGAGIYIKRIPTLGIH